MLHEWSGSPRHKAQFGKLRAMKVGHVGFVVRMADRVHHSTIVNIVFGSWRGVLKVTAQSRQLRSMTAMRALPHAYAAWRLATRWVSAERRAAAAGHKFWLQPTSATPSVFFGFLLLFLCFCLSVPLCCAVLRCVVDVQSSR